ncbi:hypothetical protein VP01_249g10 [Puccinia sorghi]|uniref:Uncharacterized protein n=1 Tax=Puccinia sorghi TaxID=27349 RepID=A0A0L6V7K1_9BASI|nr:hypothetical protein VP01_249g10 [Puccinia sorghi]
MTFSKAEKHSGTMTEPTQHIIKLSPEEEDSASIGECHHRSSTAAHSASTSTDHFPYELLASLVLALPLPNPTQDYYLTGNPTAPLLLYTLPRAPYEKPAKNEESGKRPKEKIIKKIQRSWQKSIQQAEDIKRGDYPHPSWASKLIGACFWVRFCLSFLAGRVFFFCVRRVSASLRFITSSDAQMLARLPPIRKIGLVKLINVLYSTTTCSSDASGSPQNTKTTASSDEQAKESLMNTLSLARRKAKVRTIISGCFLPPAYADAVTPLTFQSEIYAPLVFELTLIYFVVQWRSWRKAQFLVERNNDQATLPKSTEGDLERGNAVETTPLGGQVQLRAAERKKLQKIDELVYRCCSEIDSLKFPRPNETNQEVEVHPDHDDATTECTAACHHTSEKKNIDKVDEPEDGEALVLDVSMISDPHILAKSQPCYDGINITTIQAQQDDETGASLKSSSRRSPQAIEVRLDGKLAINAGSTHETVVLATSDSEPRCGPTTLASSCASQATSADPKESKPIATHLQHTDAATDTVSTGEITQPEPPPSVDHPNHHKTIPNLDVASLLINIFKDLLPAQVFLRHESNERRVAEDFNRILNKRLKQYVKSIKKKKNQ